MAIDKAVNTTLNISTLLPTDFIYVGRPSTGEDCWMTAQDLKVAVNSTIIKHVGCDYNSDTKILICSAASLASFLSATIDCYFLRNGKARKETIEIFYNNGVAGLIEGQMGTIPETETDLGITISAIISTGLNLNINLNAEAVNADFYYTTTSILTI